MSGGSGVLGLDSEIDTYQVRRLYRQISTYTSTISLWFGLASRIWKLMMATILGTDLDSARHKLRVSDEKQDSHPKLEAKSPPESLPPVWDTFCQVDFSCTSYGFVIFLCSISSQQQSATLSGWLEMIVNMKLRATLGKSIRMLLWNHAPHWSQLKVIKASEKKILQKVVDPCLDYTLMDYSRLDYSWLDYCHLDYLWCLHYRRLDYFRLQGKAYFEWTVHMSYV